MKGEAREFVPGDFVIWQSDTAKTYQCPTCKRPVFSQHEGPSLPEIVCLGNRDHELRWPSAH